MITTERQDKILEVIRENVFVTVNELSKITFTSPSSVRRDLTYLQNNGLVRRTHGGVTLSEDSFGVASFHFRREKNKNEKRVIAKKAAALFEDRQTILLDGSSTAMYLLPYIAKNPSLKIYTNNLSTALEAINLGIITNCTGGHSIDGSIVLTGPDACKVVDGINADICFFSSKCLDKDGMISDPMIEDNYIRQVMIKNSKKTVFLCDSSKFNSRSLYNLAPLDKIDICIFDKPFQGLICDCEIL